MPTREAYFGAGMYIEPRDFMKIGQVVLEGGARLRTARRQPRVDRDRAVDVAARAHGQQRLRLPLVARELSIPRAHGESGLSPAAMEARS